MTALRRFVSLLLIISILFSGCTVMTQTPTPTEEPKTSATPMPSPMPTYEPAAVSGNYRNLFAEYLGKSDDLVQATIDAAWQQLFYGDDDNERVYYPAGDDMAYMEDIGNGDVRSEGMSYGMMIAVQLDHKEEFDRLWKWTKTYMYQEDGPYQGYFAWHCTTDGEKLDANPASDGEEWFVTALFFAAARWGNGEGIYDYQAEANAILHTMLHKNDEDTGLATNMFDPETKQVVFVPRGRDSTYTDPSYHLPHYYELWAAWAAEDNDFWADAAQVSRDFFHDAADPGTGLMADYAHFDGTPREGNEHEDFRYDAWRTLAHVALDYAWFGVDPWQVERSNRVLSFLASQGMEDYPSLYTVDGEPLGGGHSTGLVAMAGAAALAADREIGEPFVQALWDQPIPRGTWRYYDGLLYLLALLYAGGQFQIYTPAPFAAD
jgi:oligosaccharide reducing-end xylanase